MRRDIAPSLRPPVGLSIEAYIEAVLQRFRNPAIRHNLSQIAWDGSQKLPIRLLGSVGDALSSGRSIARLAAPVAGWMRFVVEAVRRGAALTDPMADRLARLAAVCVDRADADVAAFLTLDSVFPQDLAATPRFREAVETAYDVLVDGGVTRLLAGLAAEV